MTEGCIVRCHWQVIVQQKRNSLVGAKLKIENGLKKLIFQVHYVAAINHLQSFFQRSLKSKAILFYFLFGSPWVSFVSLETRKMSLSHATGSKQRGFNQLVTNGWKLFVCSFEAKESFWGIFELEKDNGDVSSLVTTTTTILKIEFCTSGKNPLEMSNHRQEINDFDRHRSFD